MSEQEYYLVRARECIRQHEAASARASAIKEAWTQYHIQQREKLRKSMHWWEKKLPSMSLEEAQILAKISCDTDFGYKSASDDAKWAMQQATMYATYAGVDVASVQRTATGIPRQKEISAKPDPSQSARV